MSTTDDQDGNAEKVAARVTDGASLHDVCSVRSERRDEREAALQSLIYLPKRVAGEGPA